ncbi:galanin receptor 2a-like [Styela clava]|uniref:rhodopsin-like n=1 Tax=Styela clava TaxID=7725 RepID=UPI00193A8C34|nr:rhodopsin-like [Styela clava]
MESTTTITVTDGANSIVTENSTYREPWQPPYTTAWVVVSAVILFAMMIFGTVANSLTIAVIRKSSKLRTKYYTLILSLCVSDLTSALLSPLFLYRRTWGFDYFALPDFFCKFYWGVDYWTSYATAMHILSFALLRFIGVQWPTTFRKINGKHIALWLATIWTLSFGCGFIPHAIFNEVKVVDRYSSQARWASCSLASRWFSTWQVYIQFAYPIFLYVPAGLVIVISAAIGIKLATHKRPGDTTASQSQDASNSVSRQIKSRRKKDKHIIMQLFLIVGSFLLGYAPVTAFHWYTGFTIDESNPELNKFDWKFAMVQYILLRFSECLNPVFYNLASSKMRKETKKLIVSLNPCAVPPGTPQKRTHTSRVSSATTSSV